ncbi:helix-turn-helix domain containing protein [Rhizobium sp. 1AS11]|uniref:helix-turn-helix domain-containing protein n=1 Tax=Rhizobium acaciae TaxID=2989736 RepID=UPI0022229BB8|nr:helix-turn-helix domain-containing protein [Rhizobium acaciae]MCW1412152.1 helix-turn-helix domain containing protein [Rhizobium acaciae]MCW1744167.1 helix-turn-helix domain containing protein [Rhizobium acaciae]
MTEKVRLQDPISAVLGHRKREKYEARFWAKVDQSGGPDACWPWTGSTFKDGSGRCKLPSGHFIGAHRMAAAFCDNASPGKSYVVQGCKNKLCCNPEHGFYSDRFQAAQDKMMEGTSPVLYIAQKGAHNPKAKLSDLGVLQIATCFAHGETNMEIASQFDIHHSMVSAIRRGKNWTHILERAGVDDAFLSAPRRPKERPAYRPAVEAVF